MVNDDKDSNSETTIDESSSNDTVFRKTSNNDTVIQKRRSPTDASEANTEKNNDSNSGDKKNLETIVRTKIKNRVAHTISSQKDESESPTELNDNQDNEIALTQICQVINSQDRSRGFEQAKDAADTALSEQKIVLNGRFVLESTLGAGGMGTVYKAKDLRKVEAEDLNPYVAVKVLNDDFKNHPDAFITLQREASRSHILSHPNIVTVHDFDRDGNLIFMTMELLEGISLEVLLRQHKGRGLEVNKAIPIIKDYCAALAFAHKKGIIHSDFKPGNVFVCEDGTTKVLDFGIARITSENAEKDFDAGTLDALTPSYASLEMIEDKQPHPSDDIYAAALIAFELFTGKHPFERVSAYEAKEKKLKPTQPPCLTKKQWQAIEKGLKLDRADRAQSIDEFWGVFEPIQKTTVFKFVSLALILLLIPLAYILFFAPNEAENFIVKSLKDGNSCLNTQDYQCAKDNAKAILQMDSTNVHAKTLLDTANVAIKTENENQLKIDIETCLNVDADIVCAKSALSQLKRTSANTLLITNLDTIISQFEQQVRVRSYLDEATTCFDAKKYDCAANAANLTLQIEPNNGDAQKVLNDIDALLAKQQLVRNDNERKFSRLLKQANRCFQTQDYTCAINSANEAQTLKPNNKEAKNIIRMSELANTEKTTNLRMAKSLVKKGQICLDKKNYTCATTNAESALDIIPGYPSAVELRESARNAVQALYKQISIQ